MISFVLGHIFLLQYEASCNNNLGMNVLEMVYGFVLDMVH